MKEGYGPLQERKNQTSDYKKVSENVFHRLQEVAGNAYRI